MSMDLDVSIHLYFLYPCIHVLAYTTFYPYAVS